MADALLSPAVGGTMWCVSAGAIAWSSRNVAKDLDERKVPLMGVLGAFLFAAQMINFSIPGTGSSGHLAGGLLLSLLLGPHAALLVVASVLFVQALFFADGGLLALGCNIFNIGVVPAFLVYPLLSLRNPRAAGSTRAACWTVLSAIAALQLGSLAVVLETWLSGVAALPVRTFLLLMQPIHLAIGIVEGVVTVAILSFFRKTRPEAAFCAGVPAAGKAGRRLLLAGMAVALLTGGILSSFASRNPDGLEWAIARATGGELKSSADSSISSALGALQQKTAVMPEYGFKRSSAGSAALDTVESAGTGIAGIAGSVVTLLCALLGGLFLKRKKGAVS
ncbi:energy-coupling factor ABC transporter permease [Geomonas sp. RF6]|uniref:energy-coupling factor ABC transporter permease n=1 Tax=Geomonas sp. RF6 TaxID=2897342 RepID=UPI002EDAA691